MILIQLSRFPATNPLFLENDTTAIILDPSVEGTGHTATEKAWTVTFPNGNTVSGVAACKSISGIWGRAYPNYNFDLETDGANCWCRMTNPTRSAWVYDIERTTASECASICASVCAYGVSSYAGIRGGLYSSAGQ